MAHSTNHARPDLESLILIDSLCDRVEQEWKSGRQPRLRGILPEDRKSGYRVLLPQMILVDRWYRQKNGQPASLDIYLTEFPELCPIESLPAEFVREFECANRPESPGDPSLQNDSVADESVEIPASIRGPWIEGYQPVTGYTALRRLGSGAFGEVWEATSTGGVPAALKRVDMLDDRGCGEAELRALELLKRVRHPHLLSIHGFWILDSTLIIASELADESLDRLIPRLQDSQCEALPVSQILRYLTDAAEALDYLGRPIHAVNQQTVRIQHCDVKPANLLVQGGALKVSDFGLARSLQGLLDNRSFSGTPAFSPPEFFQGRVAAASDQYSLAVTYYQLRTGRLPFAGSVAEIATGHLHGTPNLDGLSATERTVVARALAKDPALRWDSCTKFIGELQRLQQSKSISDPSDQADGGGKTETAPDPGQSTVVYRGQSLTTGMLLIGEELIPVPLQKSQLHVVVMGATAEVTLTQFFVNCCDVTIEATYVFPLPDDAAVSRMRMIVDDRIIESEVRKNKDARRVYEQAQQGGHGAALLEQTSPNVFASSIANILPGQEVRVEIKYLQALPFDDGMYCLVVPMVISPRYVPGSNPAAQMLRGTVPEAILAPRLSPGFVRGDSVEIDAEIDAGVPLCGFNSPSHDIKTVAEEGTSRVRICLRECDEIPNRDFILNYRVLGHRIEHALVYEPEHNGEPGTFLLLTTPPASPIERINPRRLAFVINCSSSMSGVPLQQAKLAALHMLDHLAPDDEFNIIAFGSHARPLSASRLAATPDELSRARAFIEQLGDLGGAELLEPLRMALRQVVPPQPKANPQSSKSLWNSLLKPFRRGSTERIKTQPDQLVIFLTDGSVTQERQILTEIRPEIGQTRIVTFGIGVAVNRHFVHKLTAASRGIAEFLTPGENITERVDRVLARLRHSVMTNIDLSFDGKSVLDMIPERIPDLFGSLPLQVFGRFRGKLPSQIMLHGQTIDETYAEQIIPEQVGRKAAGTPILALWARRKIEALMDLLWEYPNQAEAIREQITELAMRYQLTSEYTSFVAVEHRVQSERNQTPDSITVAVPQVMPYGMGIVGSGVQGNPLDQLFESRATSKSSAGNASSKSSARSGGRSIQSKLDRVRKPRVHITYDLHDGSPYLKKTLPFVIGVVGDFSGTSIAPISRLADRNFVAIDRDNFNEVMSALPVALHFSVANCIDPDAATLDLQLTFRAIDDFEPDGVIGQVEPMRHLQQSRARLAALLVRCQTESHDVSADDSGFDEECRNLFAELKLEIHTLDHGVQDALIVALTDIDFRLSTQLTAILHHPIFQKLEGSWRGLHHLIMNAETSSNLKLRMLNITKMQLLKDLNNSIEFNQSELFKKIYLDEFCMPGGAPYGALIGDFEFTNHPEDIYMLHQISNVAAAAHCPFIAAANPGLFGLESWTELTRPIEIEKYFISPKYTKWNSFRDSENSRYVTLVMPRVLARSPYVSRTKSVGAFGYEEFPMDLNGEAKPPSHNDYCWMNAAYAMATNMTRAVAETGWCTAIRGRENGGRVENLPLHHCMSTDGELVSRCPTEISVTDHCEKELSDQGLLALCHHKNTDCSVFFSGQTTQRPRKYTGENELDATANAAISARLPYIMATSRFAHYLKCIARDKIGAFVTCEDMEEYLKHWITDYVLPDDTASQEMKARYPLAEARITVHEIPGDPGSYNAEFWLKPHLQFETLTVSQRMGVKLPRRV